MDELHQVAEENGYKQSTAERALRKLSEQGDITPRKDGKGNNVIYAVGGSKKSAMANFKPQEEDERSIIIKEKIRVLEDSINDGMPIDRNDLNIILTELRATILPTWENQEKIKEITDAISAKYTETKMSVINKFI